MWVQEPLAKIPFSWGLPQSAQELFVQRIRGQGVYVCMPHLPPTPKTPTSKSMSHSRNIPHHLKKKKAIKLRVKGDMRKTDKKNTKDQS